MSKIIAVAGKGGVGKSTFSALVIKTIIRKTNDIILAVDADSNSTLAQMLGIDVESTIGDLREDLMKDPEGVPSAISKFEYVQYQLRLALAEGERFDLVTMGRPEGPGCYCYINNILRTYMDALTDKYAYIVIDNEAGMEHLSRRTTRTMDKFFIITDFTPIGFETAVRIHELAMGMDIKINDIYLVINRIPQESQTHQKILDLKESFPHIFFIPPDDELVNYAFDGRSILELPDDSKAVKAINEICKNAELM